MERKLYRSRRDRMISGVCGGIAEYFEIDPTLVRLAAAVLAIASFGTALIAYVVMALVVPEEPVGSAEGSGSTMVATPGAPAAPPPPSSEVYAPPGAPPSSPPSAPAPDWPPPPRRRPGRAGVTFGVILVILGLLLLVSQFVPGLDLWRLWPLIIVAIGIRVMLSRKSGD